MTLANLPQRHENKLLFIRPSVPARRIWAAICRIAGLPVSVDRTGCANSHAATSDSTPTIKTNHTHAITVTKSSYRSVELNPAAIV
jgi:hypothetical protein